jgi:hypothetical protein
MIVTLIKKLLPKSRSTFLLLSVVLIVFFYPSISESRHARYLLGILFAVTPLAGVYAVSDNRRIMVAATILGLPALIAVIGHFFLNLALIRDELYLSLIVVYYVFTTAAVIRHLFRRRKVDADTIITAVSAYLMIGLSFAVTYMLVALRDPGAFVQSTVTRALEWQDLFYFSFVTLTTLGYGDITPIVSHARSLAIFESVCGVIYMSTLIARLVSEYRHE